MTPESAPAGLISTVGTAMGGGGPTRLTVTMACPWRPSPRAVMAAAAEACARNDPDRVHRVIVMEEYDPQSLIPHLLD